MKAIVQIRYGSVDDLELQEVPMPAVGDEDALVRVRAASLHPDVWHVVTGRPYVLRLMGGGAWRPRCRIPGTDMAGIVERVGRRVTAFRPGDAVFGETSRGHPWMNGGAFAEYVSVPAELLASKPGNVTFEQAASVPTSGFIVLFNLRDPTLLGAGRSVLINGAGGGVGSLALQIAKSYGAHVTGVDSTSKQELMRSLGADAVIDYTREDFTRRGVCYHLIVDVPGTRRLSAFKPALTPDGRYIPIGHEGYGQSGSRAFGLLPHFLTLMFLARFVPMLRGRRLPPPGKPEVIARLGQLLAEGTITPVIDSVYALGEARAALHHMIADELHGKVVITVA